jgi:hypothetical protein
VAEWCEDGVVGVRGELTFGVVDGSGGGSRASAGGAFESGVEGVDGGVVEGVVERAGGGRGGGAGSGSRASASGARVGGASDAGAHLGWCGSILVW